LAKPQGGQQDACLEPTKGTYSKQLPRHFTSDFTSDEHDGVVIDFLKVSARLMHLALQHRISKCHVHKGLGF
jgi:hypothetical protein